MSLSIPSLWILNFFRKGYIYIFFVCEQSASNFDKDILIHVVKVIIEDVNQREEICNYYFLGEVTLFEP